MPLVSQVSICNAALAKLGDTRISSITQDTRAAVLLNSVWDQTRQAVMRAHPWNFAIKRAALAPTATEPTYEWAYEYDLPNDYLRELQATDSTEEADLDYAIEGRKILSDEATLFFKYIYNHEDWSEWDSCFCEALAWKLAHQICFGLTKSIPLMQEMEKGYKIALAEARTMDGMEGTLRGLEATTWIDRRR